MNQNVAKSLSFLACFIIKHDFYYYKPKEKIPNFDCVIDWLLSWIRG